MLLHLARKRPWQPVTTTLSDHPTRGSRSSMCRYGAPVARGVAVVLRCVLWVARGAGGSLDFGSSLSRGGFGMGR
jgi:hypothetical protein